MQLLQRILSSINRPNSRESRLLRIEISRERLIHNVSRFQRIVGDRNVAVVLKSNAYGHGLIEVGKTLDRETNISSFCVDSVVEARLLRAHSVQKPIIILGYIPQAGIAELDYINNVTICITSLHQAEYFSKHINFLIDVHVKVDTGMHRNGIMPNELSDTLGVLSENAHISITGLATHLADADGETSEKTQNQLSIWNEVVAKAKEFSPLIQTFHFAATAGTAYIDNAESNLVRLGIGMYGFDTVAKRNLELRPALSFHAKIINRKVLHAGESIGYNFTFTAVSDTEIAIIPAGYQEGIGRDNSNKGVVTINNQPANILGRVSMNLTAIDVSSTSPLPEIEDEVEVISNKPENHNSVSQISKRCNAIPYEILTLLSPDIRREIID